VDARSYRVGDSRISLIFGDITTSQAEVIVSSDDYLLSMGGGVSAAILQAAGPRYRADALKLTPARLAEVVVSAAGELPAKYVMHAITLGPASAAGELPGEAVVRQTTQRALRLATSLGCSSIAFPSIGSGWARIAEEVVATEMAGALVDHLPGLHAPLEVELYLMEGQRPDGGDFFPHFEAFAARTRGLEASVGAEGRVLAPPRAEVASVPPGTPGAGRLRDVYEMLRHLDERRDRLEAALVKVLAREDVAFDQAVSSLRAQLEDIAALRRNYEAELAPPGRPAQRALDRSVFVSSTELDLHEHRTAVRSAIGALHLRFVGMEDFTPTVTAPAELIRDKVESAEVYLGIIGMRYGSVDPASGFSMTELEYRQALASGKPLCMFVMGRDAPISVAMVEDDPERFAKLCDFRSRVLAAHLCAVFNSVEELAHKAEASLKDVFRL
jgi:O-acetyl-ADP-ribose deacetylase (regulator of RNase III)